MQKSRRGQTKASPRIIPLSADEFLVPLARPSRVGLQGLHRALKEGATLYAKSVGSIGRSDSGDFLFFAKLRLAKPSEHDSGESE